MLWALAGRAAVGADDAPPNTPKRRTIAAALLLKTSPRTQGDPPTHQMVRRPLPDPAAAATAAASSARQKRLRPGHFVAAVDVATGAAHAWPLMLSGAANSPASPTTTSPCTRAAPRTPPPQRPPEPSASWRALGVRRCRCRHRKCATRNAVGRRQVSGAPADVPRKFGGATNAARNCSDSKPPGTRETTPSWSSSWGPPTRGRRRSWRWAGCVNGAETRYEKW